MRDPTCPRSWPLVIACATPMVTGIYVRVIYGRPWGTIAGLVTVTALLIGCAIRNHRSTPTP